MQDREIVCNAVVPAPRILHQGLVRLRVVCHASRQRRKWVSVAAGRNPRNM